MEEKLNGNKPEEDELKEKINMLSSYIEPYDKSMNENDMQFESKIIYLGAGAIALAIAWAGQHPEYEYTRLLVIGLTLLCITVCMNLYSEIWFKDKLKKDINELMNIANGIRAKQVNDTSDKDYIDNKDVIDKDLPGFYKYLYDKVINRNSRGDNFNRYNLWILFAGIVITLLYAILNLI